MMHVILASAASKTKVYKVSWLCTRPAILCTQVSWLVHYSTSSCAAIEIVLVHEPGHLCVQDCWLCTKPGYLIHFNLILAVTICIQWRLGIKVYCKDLPHSLSFSFISNSTSLSTRFCIRLKISIVVCS